VCIQIVVHKKSGFSIDPYHGEKAAELMADFFEAAAKDPEHWLRISRGALLRIKEKCAALLSPLPKKFAEKRFVLLRSHSGAS
jgi:hypothetical protein